MELMNDGYLARVRCTKKARVELLEGVFNLEDGMVITIYLKEARLMQRYGLGKIVSVIPIDKKIPQKSEEEG